MAEINSTQATALTQLLAVSGLAKVAAGTVSSATAGTDYAVGATGLAGGQTLAGGTLTTQTLTLKANAVDDMSGVVGKSTVAWSATLSGGDVSASLANLSNTATSRAVITSQVAGATAGDAVFQAVVAGVTTWTFGIDNSITSPEADVLVFARAATLGTNRDILSLSGSAAGVGALVQVGSADTNGGSSELRVAGPTGGNIAQSFFINGVLQTEFVQFNVTRLGVLVNGGATEVMSITNANANLLVGTTTDVATTKVRVDASKTLAQIAGSVWDGIDFIASTLTLSNATNVTTATGVNAFSFRAPTISSASTPTVTAAATVAITGAPAAAGAGPAVITGAYALWVQGGQTRLDGVLRVAKSAAATPTVFGDLLAASGTGFANQIEVGNTTGSCGLRVGQDATHSLGFSWIYNATPASAQAQLDTFGFANSLTIDASTVLLGTRQASCDVLVGTVTDVATTKLRVDVSKTLAQVAGSAWDGADFIASTLTLSNGTNVTTATGMNAFVLRAPTLTSASTPNVTAAATLVVTGAPVAGGTATITAGAAYATWVQGGATRLDGRLLNAKGADVAAAATLTLGSSGNTFKITGNTNVDFITTTGWTAGSVLVLLFSGTPTVNHNTGSPPANTAAVKLASSVPMLMAADSVLVLFYDGTVWQEMSRKAA